jgi:hypothetical protein
MYNKLFLTAEETEMVCEALQSFYLDSLKMIEENRRLINDEAVQAILKRANAFDTLRSQIDNGEKDLL